MNERLPLYVFLHVPKTGGSTINRHLRRHLDYDEVFVHLGGAGRDFRKAHGRADWEARPVADRSRARVIAGHWARYGVHELLPDREPRYFTVLREPASRIVSAYNFQMQQRNDDQDFWQWYEDYPRNVAFKALRKAFGLPNGTPYRDVADRIDTLLWFVGVTEHLDEDLPALFTALGTPGGWVNQRVATTDRTEVAASLDDDETEHLSSGELIFRRLEVTDAIRDRLLESNRRDAKLHRLARRVRERTLTNVRDAS
jgi:hypothetical protein